MKITNTQPNQSAIYQSRLRWDFQKQGNPPAIGLIAGGMRSSGIDGDSSIVHLLDSFPWPPGLTRIDWLIFSTFQERWLPCEISLCESSNRFQFWNLTHNGYTWKISAASQASGWTQNQLQQWTSHQWMIKWCIGAEIWGNHDDFSCLKQENCWNSVAKSREKCKTDAREIQNAQDARNPLDLRQMRSGKWVATEVANGWRP